MATLGHYSPEDVSILVAGVIPLVGLTDGSFVTISKDVQPFTSVRTTDGRVARLYSNDQTYTISITLHSASEGNDTLTKLWQIDELLQRAKFPLLIKDNLGSSFFFSTTSWIEQIPVTEYSTVITDRTWVIKSSQAIYNIGGNAEAAGLLDVLVSTVLASAGPILEGLL